MLTRMIFTLFFSDEIPTDDLPWRKSNTCDSSPFSGFEEAGLDTVNELTKVITSNILNIDVPGKICLYASPKKEIFLQVSSR